MQRQEAIICPKCRHESIGTVVFTGIMYDGEKLTVIRCTVCDAESYSVTVPTPDPKG